MGRHNDGAGMALTLSPSSWAGRIIRIDSINRSVAEMDDTPLEKDAGSREVVFATLSEEEPVSITYIYDMDDPPPLGVPQTATFTFPLLSDEATAANIAGTGAFTSDGTGPIAHGERMLATATFKFDGKTGPTYTPAVPD